MEKHWSGERLETFVFNENMVEHLHRYSMATRYVQKKVVLDIACGEGYGTNLLSEAAAFVFGVDISSEIISAATDKYRRGNISFLQGSADKIPVKSGIIDVVVSFETIEHHDRHEEMLLEIKRVLKPAGILIMSSPDKRYYTDETRYNNPFHVKELYANQFRELIGRRFKHAAFLHQRFMTGSIMIAEGGVGSVEVHRGNYGQLDEITSFTPVYNLVVASDEDYEPPVTSIFSADQWHAMLAAAVEARFKASATWKIGRLIISPIYEVKRLFKKR